MSNEVAIKVEGLSKAYRIGLKEQQHETMLGALAAWVKSPLKNFREVRSLSRFDEVKGEGEDSRSKIEDGPSSNSKLPSPTSPSDVIWALNDVSFEVKHGEAIGIIGRNGAGKSTLLKILSRITEPTRGRATVYGRVASLLEVGTGFHPDLTGRENVYLNGTILGMKKREIDAKFDEIVDFSGVEKFIDTPVKRYSSGMRVRLAFAVAAHLEPEILIIDEVLAVGDASFQKKCLGKMGEVAEGGRTVLFVSHNMVAVLSLCRRALVLSNGKLTTNGPTEEAVQAYLSQDFCASLERRWANTAQAPQGGGFRVLEARLVPVGQTGSARLTVNSAFDLVFRVLSDQPAHTNLSLHFMTPAGEIGFAVASPLVTVPAGQTAFRCHVPPNLLNDGTYTIELLVVENSKAQVVVKDALTFEIDDHARTGAWMGKWPGFVRPHLNWDYEHLADNAKT